MKNQKNKKPKVLKSKYKGKGKNISFFSALRFLGKLFSGKL